MRTNQGTVVETCFHRTQQCTETFVKGLQYTNIRACTNLMIVRKGCVKLSKFFRVDALGHKLREPRHDRVSMMHSRQTRRSSVKRKKEELRPDDSSASKFDPSQNDACKHHCNCWERANRAIFSSSQDHDHDHHHGHQAHQVVLRRHFKACSKISEHERAVLLDFELLRKHTTACEHAKTGPTSLGTSSNSLYRCLSTRILLKALKSSFVMSACSGT